MKTLKQMKTLTIITSILVIIIGIMFLAFPVSSSIAAIRTIAVMFMISGVIDIYSHFKYKNVETIVNKNSFIIGVFDIILGIFMIRQQGISVIMFSIMFSVFVFFSAIDLFEYSIMMKRIDVKGWLLLMIFSTLLIIDSIAMIANPGLAFGTLVYWISFSLIFTGVATIISIITFDKKIKAHKEKLKEYIDSIKSQIE